MLPVFISYILSFQVKYIYKASDKYINNNIKTGIYIMRIDSQTIFLTNITYDNTADIVRWRNQKFVQENFIYQKKFTPEIHNKWMQTMVESGQVIQFIIWECKSNKKIGSVYLRDIDYINKKSELGIFIGEKDALGKGYGKLACHLILSYTFEHLNLSKIFLRLLSTNNRAFKCYNDVGFVQEGLFKQDVFINGQPQDIIFMAIFSNTFNHQTYEEHFKC